MFSDIFSWYLDFKVLFNLNIHPQHSEMIKPQPEKNPHDGKNSEQVGSGFPFS